MTESIVPQKLKSESNLTKVLSGECEQNKFKLPVSLMQKIEDEKNISWAARGVLFYFTAHPEEPFTLEKIRSLPAPKPIGRDLGKAIINELIENGYVSAEGKELYYLKQRISEKLRQQVFERDGFCCVECGSKKRLSADHIIPERHGGETEIDNLQTLCKPCNSEKGSKLQGGLV